MRKTVLMAFLSILFVGLLQAQRDHETPKQREERLRQWKIQDDLRQEKAAKFKATQEELKRRSAEQQQEDAADNKKLNPVVVRKFSRLEKKIQDLIDKIDYLEGRIRELEKYNGLVSDPNQ